MFWHRETAGPVEFAFTTEDVRSDVVLDRVADALGLDRPAQMTQVHGADVAWAADAADAPPVADALLTGAGGPAVLVRVADCVPIVLAARAEPLAGVVHCGREGLLAGVVTAAVDALRERGASELRAWVGPRACGGCYELPADLADRVGAAVPGSRSTTTWGTPSVDLGAGVVGQLESWGVAVTDLGRGACTIEDEAFFSYRRQGQASGRFGAIAVVR